MLLVMTTEGFGALGFNTIAAICKGEPVTMRGARQKEAKLIGHLGSSGL